MAGRPEDSLNDRVTASLCGFAADDGAGSSFVPITADLVDRRMVLPVASRLGGLERLGGVGGVNNLSVAFFGSVDRDTGLLTRVVTGRGKTLPYVGVRRC